MGLFKSLGFGWDRNLVPHSLQVRSIEESCSRFKNSLPEFVWNTGSINGNPFTYSEVKTLLEGFTVGGHRIVDHDQIVNLIDASKCLLSIVGSNKFIIEKSAFIYLHEIAARNEFLEWGWFRGEGDESEYTPIVSLGDNGHHTPFPTIAGAKHLNQLFSNGTNALINHSSNPFERAVAFFLFGSLHNFFFDGNMKTSLLMMNGILMSSGIDAIIIPTAKESEFNEKMVRFYQDKNATEMIQFFAECI